MLNGLCIKLSTCNKVAQKEAQKEAQKKPKNPSNASQTKDQAFEFLVEC